MITRSGDFDNAVRGGGSVSVRAVLLQRGVPAGTLNLLPGASIQLSETAEQRRTFSGTVANDGTLTPTSTSSLLAPYQLELVPYTGLAVPSGSVEYVPQGIFRVNVTEDATTGVISLSGPDRSFVVSSALNEAPVYVAGGTSLVEAIGSQLTAKYPALQFIYDAGASSCVLASGVMWQENDDPWADYMALANDFGRELFIDTYGRAVLQVIPDPKALTPVWVYAPGAANLAISGTWTMDTSQNVFNVVVVQSQGTGVATPVQGTAEITDITSPIFPDPNGFGRRPGIYTTTQLLTVGQCEETAQGLLNRMVGINDSISFSAVPHPAHEPGDVVSYASKALGVSVNLVLSSWKYQLDMLSPTSYTTRLASSTVSGVLNAPGSL